MVGRGDLLQGLALMSLLAARRLVRWSAQALGPAGARRFFEPVARRRLAAVRTVQPKPPLKLGDPRLQSRDLRRLRRDQRNQLFTRRLAQRIRIRTHRILESKADSGVEETACGGGGSSELTPPKKRLAETDCVAGHIGLELR